STLGTDTNPQSTAVSGNGSYGPVGYTPGAPGTYHWQAQYTPVATDVNNLASDLHNATCNDAGEDVVVNQVPTGTTSREFVFPQDKAKIDTNPSGLTPDGSVTF